METEAEAEANMCVNKGSYNVRDEVHLAIMILSTKSSSKVRTTATVDASSTTVAMGIALTAEETGTET